MVKTLDLIKANKQLFELAQKYKCEHSSLSVNLSTKKQSDEIAKEWIQIWFHVHEKFSGVGKQFCVESSEFSEGMRKMKGELRAFFRKSKTQYKKITITQSDSK